MNVRRGSLSEHFCREEWNIAVVPQSAADIVRRGIVETPRWFKPLCPLYGLADPAVIVTADGNLSLFAERINYLSGRGEIWSAAMAPDDDPTLVGFQLWAKSTSHLSYPFPFRGGNGWAFTMEACESGGLWLWQKQAGKWVGLKIMDRPAVDPTIWRGEDNWWLFCAFADHKPDETLHLFFASRLEGPWTPHPSNPIKIDLGSSRPAGPLFRADGLLIRPSQDCNQTYGGAVVLNAIKSMDRLSYHEEPVRRLAPLTEYPDGLHTFCPVNDNITLIDGKRWAFHLVDPMRYLFVGMLKHYRRQQQRRQLALAPLAIELTWAKNIESGETE